MPLVQIGNPRILNKAIELLDSPVYTALNKRVRGVGNDAEETGIADIWFPNRSCDYQRGRLGLFPRQANNLRPGHRNGSSSNRKKRKRPRRPD